jgi:exonuclease VII large subunit
MADELKKESVDTETKEPEKKEWDKEKQLIDQYEASIRKVTEEKSTLDNQVKEATSKIEQLESQLKAKAEAESVKIENLDDALVDPAVTKSLKGLQEQLAKATEKLSLLEHKQTKQEQERQIAIQKEQTIERILKPLDEEFGAKYRNDAVKLSDKWLEDGKYKKPTDALDAALILRKAYVEVTKEAISKKPLKVPSDNGTGSIVHYDDEIGTGDRATILERIRKRGIKT